MSYYGAKSAIKNFLEKMKTYDGIPEELAEDAAEMVEEFKDACQETDELPVEEVKTEIGSNDEDLNEKIKNAVMAALSESGVLNKDEDIESLDEVESELIEKSDAGDEMNEEEVTVSSDSMNRNIRFVKSIKPIIASINDSRTRRRLSDCVAKYVRNTYSNNDAQYSNIFEAAKKNAADKMANMKSNDADYDFGMEVAKKFNPHYKEV